MSDSRQILGRRGEELAAEALTARGYRVLDKNFRCSQGEVDIIAMERSCYVFVEVRSRTIGYSLAPEDSVTATKQDRLRNVAETYLEERNLGEVDWRIDVVAIDFDRSGHLHRLEIIPDAILG